MGSWRSYPISQLRNIVRWWQISCLLKAAVLCLAALPMAVASQAQSVADRRAEAVALWLSDHEPEGLHVLSGLARGGDAWAQLLLGLIDKTSEMQGP